jgi:hypothetical protein
VGHANRICRLGLLALGLGLGAAAAATPGIAAADTPDLNDLAISFDGYSLFQEGTATAYSTAGGYGLAIADGAGSYAYSGTADNAIAIGANSTATALFGDFDTSIADGTGSYTYADGNFDTGIASGTDSAAGAIYGNDDTAIASGTNSWVETCGLSNSDLSNGDFGAAIGVNASAEAGSFTSGVTSDNDVAIVVDPDPNGAPYTNADAGNGDFDFASVFGNSSWASAGVSLPALDSAGSYDFASVFGDLLGVNASGGDFLFDILPSL